MYHEKQGYCRFVVKFCVFKGKNRHIKISQFECRVIEKLYRLRGAKKGKENTGNIIVPSDDDKIGKSKNLFRKCVIERSNI